MWGNGLNSKWRLQQIMGGPRLIRLGIWKGHPRLEMFHAGFGFRACRSVVDGLHLGINFLKALNPWLGHRFGV